MAGNPSRQRRQGAGMSNNEVSQADGWWSLGNDAFDVARELGVHAFAVLCCLERYADRNGCCWPSQGRIAEGLGISRSKVQLALDEFQDAGVIEAERVKHQSNRYRITQHRAGARGAHAPTEQAHVVRMAGARGACGSNWFACTNHKQVSRRQRQLSPTPNPWQATR